MKHIIQSERFDVEMFENNDGNYEVRYGSWSGVCPTLGDAMQEFVECLNHSMLCESVEINWPNGGESILAYQD